jgi:tetratricopeptide (TPR) repeat protein
VLHRRRAFEISSKDIVVAEKPVAKPPVSTVRSVQVGGESFTDRVLPHLKKIIAVAVAVVAVLAVIFGLRARAEGKRADNTGKLANVLTTAAGSINPAPEVAAAGSAAATAPTGFVTRADRGGAVLNELAKNNTAPDTQLLTASMLYEAGKFSEAIMAYQKLTNLAGFDGVIAREGLGLALEAAATAQTDAAAQHKGYEDALAAFKSAQPTDGGDRRAYSLYHEGRMLVLLQKKADAKIAFEKAKELAANTGLADLVQDRIAALGRM